MRARGLDATLLIESSVRPAAAPNVSASALLPRPDPIRPGATRPSGLTRLEYIGLSDVLSRHGAWTEKDKPWRV